MLPWAGCACPDLRLCRVTCECNALLKGSPCGMHVGGELMTCAEVAIFT